MMRVVFLGPTLTEVEARILVGAKCEIRPPARRGDVYSAASAGARVIGLIDGYFRSEASVLHKEILWAIDQGCLVLGAASMGALRAAELQSFGMVGIGPIFEAFACGSLHRDDEVAVEHGPREVGYVQLSEPLVNIRFTLQAGVTEGCVDPRTATLLLAIATDTYYPNRNYERLFALFKERHGIGAGERVSFGWIESHRVDQKATDARLLLNAMRSAKPPLASSPRLFSFEDTAPFHDFRSYVDNPLTSHMA